MTAPYVDPKLERLRPLIDSLTAAAGVVPDSVLFRYLLNRGKGESGLYEPARKRLTVAPTSRDRRRTLLHEFGHALQFADQSTFYRWLDPKAEGVPLRQRDLERFADSFADAFDALSRRDTVAARHPRLRLLTEYLRQRPPFAGDSTEADRVPAARPSDDRQPRQLRRRGAP